MLEVIDKGKQSAAHPVPLLFVHGGWRGAWCPHEVIATASAHRTAAEFFPAMGHNMMLEPGWHAVAERIVDGSAGRGL